MTSLSPPCPLIPIRLLAIPTFFFLNRIFKYDLGLPLRLPFNLYRKHRTLLMLYEQREKFRLRKKKNERKPKILALVIGVRPTGQFF